LTKLDIEGNKPAPGAIVYNSEDCKKDIGYVTSAMWSPAVKSNIALAMIKTEYLQGELWAEIYFYKDNRPYRRMALSTPKQGPFWAPARARATPPADY
jgi:aminomethyltransferase